jgi:hypothetical protein
MITYEPISADNFESVTARHLQEVRRTLDSLFDVCKRQTELTGRLGLDVNQIKSDVVLLENRSLTAMENDNYLRRKVDELTENMGMVLSSVVSMQKQLSDLADAVAHPTVKKEN